MREVTKRTGFTAGLIVLFFTLTMFSAAGSADDSKTVPLIDGGLGSCTADFTITDADNKPLYDAKIQVHIAYGFMNAHKLDLEVGTNVDGKARVTGLPDRIKHGFYFYATHGDQKAQAFDDPTTNCKAQFSLTLRHAAKQTD